MLCKLDGFFCNAEWDIGFASHILHALSSSLSDHCLLLLANDGGPRRPKTFCFENHWTKVPSFQKVIDNAWNENYIHVEPYQRLFHKLKTIIHRLRSWSKSLFAKAKVQLHPALQVILHLDFAQEQREVSQDECDL